MKTGKLSLVLIVFLSVFLGACQSSLVSLKPSGVLVPYVEPGKIDTFVVLSAGGFRGIFEISSIYCLTEIVGIDVDGYAGVSIGAFVGAMAVQGKISEFRTQWLSVENKDEIFQEPGVFGALVALLSGKTGLNNVTKLKKFILENIDINKLRTSGIEFQVGVVNFQTGNYETHRSDNPDFLNSILASASVPFAFPLVEINGQQYGDGGVKHMLPLQYLEYAISAGAKRIIVILPFNRKNTYIPYKEDFSQLREKYDNLIDVAERLPELVMHTTYSADLKELERIAALHHEVEFIIIEPEQDSKNCNFGVLGEFDHDKMVRCDDEAHLIVLKLFKIN